MNKSFEYTIGIDSSLIMKSTKQELVSPKHDQPNIMLNYMRKFAHNAILQNCLAIINCKLDNSHINMGRLINLLLNFKTAWSSYLLGYGQILMDGNGQSYDTYKTMSLSLLIKMDILLN